MYATARVGAILVPVNPRYQERELTYTLQHSGAKMLVAASSCKGVDILSTVQAATSSMLSPGRQLEKHMLEHLLILDAPSVGKQA